MVKTLKKKTVKVRKARGCEWCGERIDKGDMAVNRAYISDGEFLADYMHPECNEAMYDVDWYWFDYRFTPGEFYRGTPRSRNE